MFLMREFKESKRSREGVIDKGSNGRVNKTPFIDEVKEEFISSFQVCGFRINQRQIFLAMFSLRKIFGIKRNGFNEMKNTELFFVVSEKSINSRDKTFSAVVDDDVILLLKVFLLPVPGMPKGISF
ncbi:MAG: hypothetical protein N3E50_03490 [Candidatus Goldbacteria bacterium]|nr:hypothetical protein [Candidatus Goldiibacteriota bacterium]